MGKNFSVSGKVLPNTMKIKPIPRENIISNPQVAASIMMFKNENSSPSRPTIDMRIM